MKLRTHEVVSKLTKAMGELLEKQPDSPVPAGAASLTDAYDRLGACLKKVTDGSLPDGMAAELKTIAGIILAAAGDPTGAAAAPAAATTPAVPPAATIAAAATKSIAALRKLELDDYTAVRVTIDSACSRLWGVQDLLRTNKMDEAMAELSGITASLTNIASLGSGAEPVAAAATTESKAMKSVEMTAEQFYAWMNTQLETAKTEEPAAAHERLSAVKHAVDAVAKVYERTTAEPRGPLTIEIADAFAPNNLGTAMDLTTKTDQKDTELSATAGLPNGSGDTPGTTGFGSNLGAVGNAIGVAMGSLLTDGGVALNTTFKSDVSKAADDEAFIWPGDMTATDPDFVDPKSEQKSRPVDMDSLGWGKDPWANSHR